MINQYHYPFNFCLSLVLLNGDCGMLFLFILSFHVFPQKLKMLILIILFNILNFIYLTIRAWKCLVQLLHLNKIHGHFLILLLLYCFLLCSAKCEVVNFKLKVIHIPFLVLY